MQWEEEVILKTIQVISRQVRGVTPLVHSTIISLIVLRAEKSVKLSIPTLSTFLVINPISKSAKNEINLFAFKKKCVTLLKLKVR